MRRAALLLLVIVGLELAGTALFLGDRASGTGSAFDGLPLDDTWIHLVYAKSFAEHLAFYYNPGQPETGMTSPLWVILLSLPLRLGLPPVLSAKLLSVLFAVLLALACFALARRVGPNGAGWIAAALVATDPYLGMARVSGMEVALFGTLTVTALVAYGAGRRILSGLCAGLAVLARPEGLVLVALLAAVEIFLFTKKDKGSFLARGADLAKVVAPAVALYLPWVAYCFSVSGRLLPSTFYVKADPGGQSPFTQGAKLLAFLGWQPFVMSGIGAILLIFTIRKLWARRTTCPMVFVLLAFPWAYLAGLGLQLNLGAIAPSSASGSLFDFYFARYLTPALPLLWVILAVGAADILGRCRPWLRLAADDQGCPPLLRRPAPRLAVAALLILFAGLTVWRNLGLADTYSLNCANILDMQVAAGRWLRAHTRPGTKIAVDDAGAIRYFSQRFTIDLHGLNYHRLVDPSNVEKEITALRPGYYAIFPSWHPNLSRAPFLTEVHRIQLTDNTICGGSLLVIYRSTMR